ncbi:hypothetical protein [Paraburkholderia ultramafica]|uniref:hypothetical protein n=1 Tax=Paraburkholderia ultramafica TaxID=1544867 RepID=UPI001582E04E|nr:hypothetical protein [Paraburkholderia ultramafica]
MSITVAEQIKRSAWAKFRRQTASFFAGFISAVALLCLAVSSVPKWSQALGGPFVVMSASDRDSLKTEVQRLQVRSDSLQKDRDDLFTKRGVSGILCKRVEV